MTTISPRWIDKEGNTRTDVHVRITVDAWEDDLIGSPSTRTIEFTVPASIESNGYGFQHEPTLDGKNAHDLYADPVAEVLAAIWKATKKEVR